MAFSQKIAFHNEKAPVTRTWLPQQQGPAAITAVTSRESSLLHHAVAPSRAPQGPAAAACRRHPLPSPLGPLSCDTAIRTTPTCPPRRTSTPRRPPRPPPSRAAGSGAGGGSPRPRSAARCRLHGPRCPRARAHPCRSHHRPSPLRGGHRLIPTQPDRPRPRPHLGSCERGDETAATVTFCLRAKARCDHSARGPALALTRRSGRPRWSPRSQPEARRLSTGLATPHSLAAATPLSPPCPEPSKAECTTSSVIDVSTNSLPVICTRRGAASHREIPPLNQKVEKLRQRFHIHRPARVSVAIGPTRRQTDVCLA